MCYQTKVLNQTKNGFLMSCSECGMYHLTFGHFYLELTKKELYHFGIFLDDIDVSYWNTTYSSTTMRRKIPIPTQQKNLYLMLHPTELEELKRLVYFRDKEAYMPLIQLEDVDYVFVEN